MPLVLQNVDALAARASAICFPQQDAPSADAGIRTILSMSLVLQVVQDRDTEKLQKSQQKASSKGAAPKPQVCCSSPVSTPLHYFKMPI